MAGVAVFCVAKHGEALFASIFCPSLKSLADSADKRPRSDPARQVNLAGMIAVLASEAHVPIRPDFQRFTLLGFVALASCFVGCSMFKEQVTPKLTAEVTPGPAPSGPPAPKFVVEIRPHNEKPQAVEKPLTESTHVQNALEITGAAKKFERAMVDVYRQLPTGGWHKMSLEYDKNTHRIPPEYDYAVLPGDRIIVTEDTTTVWDDMMERTLKPLGINPPRKKDPIKERYQIQG
jgi:hypothetical protein